MTELGRRLARPVDGASLAAFRFLLGAVMFGGLVRYVANGWIEIVFVEPTFFFRYPGFEWVFVPGPTGLYLLFGLAAASALAVALGAFHRVAIVTFLLSFTYIQLMDVTNYLNHYYLVVLFALLMSFMPLDRALSVRTWLRPSDARATVPAWMPYLLRFQVGVVYLHAALAKVGVDWLAYGQPLNIWMSARNELPIIGPWIELPAVALFMSWAGFLYDLSIVPLLLWKRTRPFAYGAVLVFHFFTWVFFDIGMFPFIMTAATTLFFEPDWPRRLLARLGGALGRRSGPEGWGSASPAFAPLAASGRFHPVIGGVLVSYCLFQALFPLRHLIYEGDVLWNERGMRYAWKVMVREKNGSVAYRVTDPASGRTWQVSPHAYLDWRQANEMAAQPDLILQLAHHVAQDFERRGVPHVEVRVDSWVSLNGRPAARMIAPDVDLLEVDPRAGDWILPPPDGPPVRLDFHAARKRNR